MMKICDADKCTGCGACAQKCPTNCITMQAGIEEGYIYPIIDSSACIECHSCQRVCPQNKTHTGGEEIRHVYRASSKDAMVLTRSTSGGMFSELARVVLKDNGIAFGASLNTDDMTVNHSYINSFDKIERFNGSKYIGSKTGNCYREAKEFLEQGRKVLFSGTPCQVDGLRSYLGKDYQELYTVDFVCHGVASSKILRLYIQYLEKKHNGKVIDLKFRDKSKGYTKFSFCVKIKKKDGKVYYYYYPSYENPFGKLFAEGKISRMSCYTCKYASTKRVSDITLADCIQDLSKQQQMTGCSLLMTNSDKGDILFECIKDDVDQCEITIDRAKELQRHLSVPTNKPISRDAILSDADRMTIEALLKKYSPKQTVCTSLLHRVANKAKRIIKRMVK